METNNAGNTSCIMDLKLSAIHISSVDTPKSIEATTASLVPLSQ